MTIQEQLRRYPALRLENENRLEKLERMRSAARLPPMKESDGSRRTGTGGDRMARAVEACIEYEEQIRPVVAANRREMERIEAAVAALADPMEREVLRLRYLDSPDFKPERWREIALWLYGSDEKRYLDALSRIHRSALEHLENFAGFEVK